MGSHFRGRSTGIAAVFGRPGVFGTLFAFSSGDPRGFVFRRHACE